MKEAQVEPSWFAENRIIWGKHNQAHLNTFYFIFSHTHECGGKDDPSCCHFKCRTFWGEI